MTNTMSTPSNVSNSLKELKENDELQSESENDWEDELGSDDVEALGGKSPVTPPSLPLPFLPSSGGVAYSSPIRGTIEEIAQIRNKKRQKKRLQTIQENRNQRQEEEATARIVALNDVMAYLHSKQLKIWDLLEFVFNPVHHQGIIRHNDFFNVRGRATQILDWWLSPENRGQRGKEEVEDWLEGYVAKKVSKEARTVTSSKLLRTMDNIVNADTVSKFDLTELNRSLWEDSLGAPFMMRVLESFSTSRHSKKHTEKRRIKTNMVC